MAISLIKITDTFNTFMDQVNSIINKINKIEVDNYTLKFKFSSSVPDYTLLEDGESIIFIDENKNLRIRIKDNSGSTSDFSLEKTEHN